MKLFWTLHTLWLLLVVRIPYGVAKKGKDGGGGDGHDGGSSTSTTSSTTVDSSSLIPSQATPSMSFTASLSSTAPIPSTTTIVTPGLGLKFADPVNTTTCDSVTFFWTPTGGLESTISLLVTNQGMPEHPPTNTITETLSESLSSNDQHFTWLHVDVAQGWYIAQAQLQNQTVLSQSSAFFVQNGSDVSCLAGINTSSTEGSTSRPKHRHSPQVQHLALGELVGIVVGSAAGVTILTMAFAFPHLWRHALTSPKRKHPYHQLF